MIPRNPDRLKLSSGEPWHLTLEVEPVGRDYICRIHGGDAHIGAVALAQWRVDRAETECLSVSGHKERAIATDAARALCSASGHSVTCVAGIHYDGLSRTEIDAIVQDVVALTRRAARCMEPGPAPRGGA